MNTLCTAIAVFTMSALASEGIAFRNIASGSEINPAGGADIAHQNPHWNGSPPWFNAAAGQAADHYVPTRADTLTRVAGLFVMDFEAGSGFGTAAHALRSNGTVFNSDTTTAPFTNADKITGITTDTGVSIRVEGRAFNPATNRLGAAADAYGVFLAGDRDANDTMTSGRQGLVFGPCKIPETGFGTGAYLTFDRDMEYVSATLNANSYAPIYFVALFDAQGNVLGTYKGGINAGRALYFGVRATQANIRSVWIGQLSFVNGVVIDDIAFAERTGAGGEDALKSQLEVRDSAIANSAPNAYRILFIGDSITRHGANADTREKLGWGIVAGMAASAPEKDFVSLLSARIQQTMPERKVEIYYDGQAEAPGNPFKPGSVPAKAFASEATKVFRPHLVVIQLGEHEEAARGEAFLREHYTKLVTAFDDLDPAPDVICVGVWQPGDAARGQDDYARGWAGTVERVMREVCEQQGIPFASVRQFALDPGYRGFGTSGGVRWHPNDKGMQGYADVLFEAFGKLKQ